MFFAQVILMNKLNI